MSNAGSSRIRRSGAVTGTVISQIPMGLQTDFDNIDFESEAIWDDAINAGAGFVKSVVSAGAGAIGGAAKTAGDIATSVVKTVGGTVSGGITAVQKEVVKIATSVPKIEVPKIVVPKVVVPKIEVPKIELPKISVSIPKIDVSIPKVDISDVTNAVAGVAALTAGGFGPATTAIPGAMMSALNSVNVPILSTMAPVAGIPMVTPTKDLVENIKCGIFGCGDQQGALESLKQAGESALNVLTFPSTLVKEAIGATVSTGSDLLKDLPSLVDIQKATQSLGMTSMVVGLSNPLTAPAAIAIGVGNYAQTLLGGKTGSDSKTDAAIQDAVAKANAGVEVPKLTVGLEERYVMLPPPGPLYSTDEYFRPGEVFQYGEDRTDLATCTVRRGDYIGFVKKYRYSETIPDECVPEGAVKYYTSLGNYKQKEMVGIPKYTDTGRLEMYDPYTGVLIQEINEEELASGSVSIHTPQTSLVYHSWATEPAVGGYNKEEASRFAIAEFRDEFSDDLEAQVDRLNMTEDGKIGYLMVDYSRLGSELYGGKVLPIDGRVLDPNLVTQETDYGKKIGLDYPVNNIKKVYGDLGQLELGEIVIPKIVAASNEKGAVSSLSEKVTTTPTVALGTITNGYILKPKTECAEGDIICSIGRSLDVINPNAICAENSTHPLCQGLRGIENTVLQLAEGVGGAIPSLADIAYDTTTGAIEKYRGLDEGSLKRLGLRQSWDNMFETAAADVVGIDLERHYFTKSLGLDKVAEGDITGMIAAGGVGLFEEFLSHPVEFLTPGVIEAELIMLAPSIGEDIAGVVTGVPKKEVQYSFMFDEGAGRFAYIPDDEVAPSDNVIENVIYTNDPSMDGRVVYSDAPLKGIVV